MIKKSIYLLIIIMTLTIYSCNPQNNIVSNYNNNNNNNNNQTLIFLNVNVVPMDSDRILEQQSVIIQNGKIIDIGPKSIVKIPYNAKKIEGKGMYLMPGLSDMHVHVWDEDHLILFIASGVTTIRNMFGAQLHLDWRELINKDELLGPNIYTAGPIIDSIPLTYNGSIVIKTPDEAYQIVANQKSEGYDFIKIYERLSNDTYLAIIEAAKNLNISVAGHVPDSMSLKEVIFSGLSSIEHLRGFVKFIQLKNGYTNEPIRYDKNKLFKLANMTRNAGVWIVPTLVVRDKTYLTPTEKYNLLKKREFNFVDPELINDWNLTSQNILNNISESGIRKKQLGKEKRIQIVRALHNSKARVLIGTDSGTSPYVVPGFSIHEELKNFILAGYTPYEAIKAGTYDAADFLNLLNTSGTIEIGKQTDLILVEENPLEDINNVAKINGLVIKGHWISKEEINKQLNKIAGKYNNEQLLG